jgi:PAS domain S-box-containing protein
MQFVQLVTNLKQSTGAAACCIVATENERLLPLCAVGEAAEHDMWAGLIAQLPARAGLYEPGAVIPYQNRQLVALPLSPGDVAESWVLLAFGGDVPPLARLAGVVALLDQALQAAHQALLLHRRTVQLERQQAVRLREIKNSRNYLRGIIDNIAVGLVLIDSDGTIRAINSSLAQRFKHEPADLVGKRYEDCLGSWEESAAAQTLSAGCTISRRIEISQDEQLRALIEVSSFPLIDTHGRIQRAVEVWDDITQQVALQNQLIRVEKLAAIGQLAASVAHEVGNPLQAVQGFIALFLESCPPDNANRYYLQVAEQEIDRVARVVARLRDFYRPSADVPSLLQLNTILDDVLLLTSKQLQRSRVALVRQLAPDLPEITGVADQLKQVLLNLVLNAIEAMPDGGRLTISTRALQDQQADSRSISRPPSRANAVQAVEVIVADSGLGIPPERIAQLFDGLQTTKARGMGLGLYTSKAIVDRHMGRIAVESSPNEGTTFRIVLPVGGKEARS